jgi:hypothetical protein
MPSFPLLKTGAVTQYPAQKSFAYSNYVARFLDGAEQRYRECAGPLSRWTIRLDLVDEAELNALELFFLDQQGAFANFSFIDPWDSTAHANCSLEQDTLDLELSGEGRGGTTLTIRENRA